MDYITKHKKRIQRNGKSQKERYLNEVTRNFNEHLKTSAAAFDIQVTEPNEPCITDNTRVIRCLINNITLNDQRNLDEKYIHIPKGIDIRIGCYVKWDNQDWLIIFREHNSATTHKTYVMRKCGQIFKYRYRNKVYPIPICISNLTLYSDGMADSVHTSIPDSKREIKFGLNDITSTIELGTRFLITSKTAYRITHINDFEHNDGETGSPGVATAIGLQTVIIPQDDLENNIAFNEESYEEEIYTNPNHITGEDYLIIGSTSRYSTGRSGCIWRLKEKYEFIEIAKQDYDKAFCDLKVQPNGKYAGKVAILELVNSVNGQVMESKEIKIRGFM